VFGVGDTAPRAATRAVKPDAPWLFATRIKIVDLCAPCPPGGEAGVFTPVAGLGQYVLLGQLIAGHAARRNGRAVYLGLENGAYTSDGLMLLWREWGVEDLVTHVFGRHDDAPEVLRQVIDQECARHTLLASGHPAPCRRTVGWHRSTVCARHTRRRGRLIVYYSEHMVGAGPEAGGPGCRIT
jgi:hypothetical protein